MKRITLFKLLLVPVIFFPVFATAAGNTAMTLLPRALAEAQDWQADAVLVSLNTSSAGLDGVGMWAYTFRSPQADRNILVMVDDDSVSRFASSYYRNDPVGEFTVDSDRAMTEAISNGLQTNEYGMNMTLESNSGRAEWRLQDDGDFYYVDANDGSFLRKEKTD